MSILSRQRLATILELLQALAYHETIGPVSSRVQDRRSSQNAGVAF